MCASVVVSICVCARWFQATLKNMNVWDWNGKCRRSGLQCVHAQEHWWAFKIERWPNRTHTFWFRVKKSVKKTLIWAYTLFLSIQFQVSILYFASKNNDLMVDWRFGDSGGWNLHWTGWCLREKLSLSSLSSSLLSLIWNLAHRSSFTSNKILFLYRLCIK